MPSGSPALYAGFWRRAAASLADGLVLAAVTIPFDFTPLQFAGPWTGAIVSMGVDWLYVAGFHSSPWQATLGKRACGIKVTDLEGRRITFGRASLRCLASILSTLILGIGFLMAGWTRRKQALHDKLVGTLVVNEAARAEDVDSSAGVMPVSGRLVAALAALMIATIAVPFAKARWTDVAQASRGEPVKSAKPAQEERIAYEIYSKPLLARDWRFVSSGTRVYRHGELNAVTLPDSNPPYIVKSLPLADGFDIQASVVPEPRVEGFGLTLQFDGGGFSWDWFNRESDDVFCKLQGPGRVRVRFASRGGNEEIAAVEFLDDVTLRLKRYWFLSFHDDDTDHVVVKKGSVFWLAD